MNSSFSRSEGGVAVGWNARTRFRRSYCYRRAYSRGADLRHPKAFGKECACACSIVITLLHIWPREHFWMSPMDSGENAGRKRELAFRSDSLIFFGDALDAVNWIVRDLGPKKE